MDIYTDIDLANIWGTIRKRLDKNEIGILPTDTIYGLTGNALELEVVERILEIKGRNNPPSLIPHSVEWARLLIAPEQLELFASYIYNFAGAYTSLWKYSDRFVKLPPPLHTTGLIGIRFPGHWITGFSHNIEFPLITTSANVHMKPYLTGLDNIPPDIKDKVDFMIYEGNLAGPPSTIIHCYRGLPFSREERR